MFLTFAKGEKPQNSVFVSSLPHTSLFFSILKRLTTEELFMNVSSEEKKRIKRGIILMKYAAVHVWRESSMSICSRRSLPASEKNEDFSTLFVFLSQQNRRKKPFPLIACCLVRWISPRLVSWLQRTSKK